LTEGTMSGSGRRNDDRPGDRRGRVAEILRREGVERVFYFPASPIAEALSAAGSARLTRQERVAGPTASRARRTGADDRRGRGPESAGSENGSRRDATRSPIHADALFPGHPGLHRA
jgi:hypothetical protein